MSEDAYGLEHHSFQPTYQTVLIRGLMDVIARMNSGDIDGTWECLKTLYRILPPDVEREVQPQYEKVRSDLDHIRLKTKSPDLPTSIYYCNHYSRKYLYSATRILLGVFKDSLHRHGYLEQSGVSALNPRPRHIATEEMQK